MPNIILDTNVVSVLFHAQEHPGVKRWLFKQQPESLYLTVITVAELLFGIRKLVKGQRRKILESWYEETLSPNFERRILKFDEQAASAWADIAAADRAIGKPRPLADGYIAAIAIANDCAIATRNERDFARLDLKVINPWN